MSCDCSHQQGTCKEHQQEDRSQAKENVAALQRGDLPASHKRAKPLEGPKDARELAAALESMYVHTNCRKERATGAWVWVVDFTWNKPCWWATGGLGVARQLSPGVRVCVCVICVCNPGSPRRRRRCSVPAPCWRVKGRPPTRQALLQTLKQGVLLVVAVALVAAAAGVAAAGASTYLRLHRCPPPPLAPQQPPWST